MQGLAFSLSNHDGAELVAVIKRSGVVGDRVDDVNWAEGLARKVKNCAFLRLMQQNIIENQ